MDEEYGKALYDMLGAVIIWRTNLYDLVKEVTGDSVPVYIYPMGLEFDLCIDGSFQLFDNEIKEIEQATGAVYTGKDVDYCFHFESTYILGGMD